MKIESVHNLNGLEAVRDEWSALWHDLGQPSPYNSWTWIWSWVNAKRLDRRLFILIARDNVGNLLGVAPLQRVPLVVPGFGVLTCIGQETSLSPDFLVKIGREQKFCESILSYILSKKDLLGVVLKMAAPLTGAAPLLEQSFSGGFGNLSIQQYSERPIVPLPESYETFLQTLSHKMRYKMRTARKKMLEEHTLEFCHNSEEREFQELLNDLFTLNELRWGKSGTRRLYESLYLRLQVDGMLKIFSLYVDGRPAAALGGLLSNHWIHNELVGFNFEVDDTHLGRCFYGLVLEWAIQHNYRFFDFGSGNEEYKFYYKPQIFPKYRVSITRSALATFLINKSRRIGKLLRWWREPAIL
jgi:CelD/BcsL family acetyltransferase involved in cellulose biosynthesis